VRLPASANRVSASSGQNIAVDKRYQTKVKVIVRNITPKARSFSTRIFAWPNQAAGEHSSLAPRSLAMHIRLPRLQIFSAVLWRPGKRPILESEPGFNPPFMSHRSSNSFQFASKCILNSERKFFNILNHVNYLFGQFGAISAEPTPLELDPNNINTPTNPRASSFGYPLAACPPRQIQFALKFYF
jgi:hypothetical protein